MRTIFLTALILSSCAENAVGEPNRSDSVFGFATLLPVTVRVDVKVDGLPARGFRAQLETRRSGSAGGEFVASALTTESGSASIRAKLPADVLDAGLDLVVHAPGYSGPWSDEAAKSAAGPFAPSSRLQLPAGPIHEAVAVDLRRVR